jgi:hypothetical protein
LILGLPSSTAVVLFLCGWDRGYAGATEMAEGSLLGLVAAVVLPLIYAQALRLGWSLAGTLVSSVGGYGLVASGLGSLHPIGAVECLTISVSAILLASYLAGRVRVPRGSLAVVAASERRVVMVRATIPAAYVILVAMADRAASPNWAGLVSTFPSMSTVLLAVTHLEEGPAAAGRLARSLPLANLSTVVFLVVFRFGCPIFGLDWAMACGIIAALANLAVIELVNRLVLRRTSVPCRSRHRESSTTRGRARANRPGIRMDTRSTIQQFRHLRPVRRRRFAPLVETLPC